MAFQTRDTLLALVAYLQGTALVTAFVQVHSPVTLSSYLPMVQRPSATVSPKSLPLMLQQVNGMVTAPLCDLPGAQVLHPPPV